jgi:hypothetical protein
VALCQLVIGRLEVGRWSNALTGLHKVNRPRSFLSQNKNTCAVVSELDPGQALTSLPFSSPMS